MSREPLVVVAIPAYDEASRIADVIKKAKTYANKVIVCDDGSADKTGEIARTLGATVVRHTRNLGYGAALSTLFKVARRLNPDVMVTLDGDGQHNPAYIPKLIRPILRDDTDVVIGSRFLMQLSKGRLPAYRKVGIALITKFASKVSYASITDAQSGFRAYSRRALQAIKPTANGMGASTEILIRARQANLRVKEMPIVITYKGQTSKQHPITHWFEVILSTVKFMSIRCPQFLYRVPGLVALVVALGSWLDTAVVYFTTGKFLADVAMLAIGSTITGIVLLSTATMLWMFLKALANVTARKR